MFQSIKEYVSTQKQLLKEHCVNQFIGLVIIQVGDNPASNSYVKGKIKDCAEVGINCKHIKLDENITEKKLLKIIKKYNRNKFYNGIIVQLPLPKHISEENVKLAINPKKDVDGFHPLSHYKPCTPLGIMDYLLDQGVNFCGLHAIVIGRSNIVGKPMAKMLLEKNCTVTVLHSKSTIEDLRAEVAKADIIIVATGKMHLLTNKFKFKENAIVIDVGINRGTDGKLHGDCDPDLSVGFQSPVPGGVGLLTRLALLSNTIKAKYDC